MLWHYIPLFVLLLVACVHSTLFILSKFLKKNVGNKEKESWKGFFTFFKTGKNFFLAYVVAVLSLKFFTVLLPSFYRPYFSHERVLGCFTAIFLKDLPPSPALGWLLRNLVL